MKQNISTLMDGELFEDDAVAVIAKIRRGSAEETEWHLYHLIGDALRQPEHMHRDLSRDILAQLDVQPTVLAPRSYKQNAVRYYALSAAASAVALALVAWLSVQIGDEPPPQLARAPESEALQPASFKPNHALNEYLLAHREVSPSANVQGTTSYIRAVSEQ